MLQYVALIGIALILYNPEEFTKMLPKSINETEKKELSEGIQSIGNGVCGTTKTMFDIVLRLWVGDETPSHDKQD